MPIFIVNNQERKSYERLNAGMYTYICGPAPNQ